MADEPAWILRRIDEFSYLFERLSYSSKRPFSLYFVLQLLSPMPENKVDPFINACLRHRLYDCAAAAAVRYNRIERILNLEELNLGPVPQHMFWYIVLDYLTCQQRWSCIKKICLSCSPSESAVRFLRYVADKCSRKCVNEEGLEVFHLLLSGYSKFILRLHEEKDVVRRVTSLGLIAHLKILIFHENEHIRRALSGGPGQEQYLVSLVRQTCLDRLFGQNFPDARTDYNACLSVVCEAGLFSLSVPFARKDCMISTAIGSAVCHNQPDVVRFLYKAGAVNNHVLFRLSRHSVLVNRSTADEKKDDVDSGPRVPAPPTGFPARDDVNAAREIRAFLTQKASRPSSLKNLCLRVVSKQVGWGHVRDANIEKLEIPECLKASLRFTGIKGCLKGRK